MKRIENLLPGLAILLLMLVSSAFGGERAKFTTANYETSGVPTKVVALITEKNLDSGSSTNSSSREWIRERGCPDDDAGHVIANRLGGGGGISDKNIFPQNLSKNRGEYRSLEQKVADMVKSCKSPVDVTVEFNFGDSKLPSRPKSLRYTAFCASAPGRELASTSSIRRPSKLSEPIDNPRSPACEDWIKKGKPKAKQ